MQELTAREAAFVAEYLVDLNGAAAARRAGYSARTARAIAAENLTKPHIQAAIKAAMEARAERVEVSADKVLGELWAIATADPNELMQFRRGCCRYCYGKGHRFQRTVAEQERARRSWQEDLAEKQAKAEAEGSDAPVSLPFDELGGTGWDPRRRPLDECPECFGEGQGEAFVTDTRNLGFGARRLYAGMKVTKDGVEIRTHDKIGALLNVGKHLGMFKDRVEHSGPDGGPIELDDAAMAAKLAAIMEAARRRKDVAADPDEAEE